MHLYWRGKQALPEHTVVTNTKLMTTIFLSNAKHWSLAPLLFFSLTFTWSPSISVFLSPTSWPHLPCLFLRSVTPHLKKKKILAPSILTYLPPCLLLIISLFFHLLHTARWQRMPWPPPQSDTSCHYTAPVPQRVPCEAGRRGWMAWELMGGRGCREHWLHGTANIRLTSEWAGWLPTGPQSHDTRQPTWQNTSVGGTCVSVVYGWHPMLPTGADDCSGDWTREGLWWQHAASLLLSEGKGGFCSLQQHMLPFPYSSALPLFQRDAFFYFILLPDGEQTKMHQQSCVSSLWSTLARHYQHMQSDRNTDALWSEQRAKLNWIIPSLSGDIESKGRGGGGKKE